MEERKRTETAGQAVVIDTEVAVEIVKIETAVKVAVVTVVGVVLVVLVIRAGDLAVLTAMGGSVHAVRKEEKIVKGTVVVGLQLRLKNN
jgi:hypothetical protein